MCLKVCHVRLLTKVNESLIPLHKKRNSFPNLIPDMLSLQIHYQQWLHGYSLSFCLRLDEIHLGFQCKGHLFRFPLSCDYSNLSFIFHFYILVQFIYAYLIWKYTSNAFIILIIYLPTLKVWILRTSATWWEVSRWVYNKRRYWVPCPDSTWRCLRFSPLRFCH